MNLSHRLLSSALLAGAVFSLTALPLTTLGSKSATIQLEGRPVFVGQLRELAGPYLALATGISLGVGAVSLAVSSWRQATDKLERQDAEIAGLKQQLNEKMALVERLRFSDTRLHSSGLEQFLQAEETIALHAAAPAPVLDAIPPRIRTAIPETVPGFDRPITTPSKFSAAGLEFFLNDEMTEPVPPQPVQPVRRVQPPAYTAFPVTPITDPVKIQPAKIQAMSALPAAQSFKSFVRPDVNATAEPRLHYPTKPSPQLNELLGHLKQVMTQIERLHASESGNRNG